VTFTSDLTVDELVLIEEAGFEPVEFVFGSTYYHLGWQSGTSWTQNQELESMSDLLLAARYTAMEQIISQASSMGADGIVGMRLDIEREGHHAEFTAIGTAIRHKKSEGHKWRAKNGRPFTCDLSGADFWALIRAGYRPVSLAHGVCVYHVAHKSLGQWFSSLGTALQNMEQVAFTQGLYEAREIAMGRMQAEAAKVGADAGVVGMQVRQSCHGWESHIMEFVAVGTAVAAVHDDAIPPDDRPIGTVMVAQDIDPDAEVDFED
jgi:uncharacterized protein YbjQ (UPF0145 family)